MVLKIFSFGMSLMTLASYCLLTQVQPIVTYQVTVYQRPPFYTGSMPLVYVEGKRLLGGSMVSLEIVYWQKFNGWENQFSYDRGILLESAQAINDHGELVAEAQMVEFSSEEHRMLFREIHYSSYGTVQFECLSSFEMGTGFKMNEIGAKGRKKKEYFFILPLR